MDKDIKHISFYMPDNLNNIKKEMDIIINECNKSIKKNLLERYVYSSTISDSDNAQLDIIFNKNKDLILNKF